MSIIDLNVMSPEQVAKALHLAAQQYALEKIHANAAESPEWIRNVIDQVLAKARGES